MAYNTTADGFVTPKSVRRGFADHSFGQKKAPSHWVTARLWAAIRPLGDLVAEIKAVDVTTLASSKGGTGTAIPPR